jgi:hypothetical protein
MGRSFSVFLFAAVLAAAMLGGGGCDTSEPPGSQPPPEALAVTAVLESYTERQRLLLTRVGATDEENLLLDDEDLVQGAQVRVGGVPFEEVPVDSIDRRARDRFDTYNYFSDSLEVEPGATYRLTVRHEGDTIRGQATMPGSFEGNAEGLRLFWQPSEEAARYRAELTYAPPDSVKTSADWQEAYLTTDTSVTVEPGSDFQPGRHYVEIQAVGSNVAAFRREETLRAGLDGAYGVFGAQTTTVGYVQLSRRPETGEPNLSLP